MIPLDLTHQVLATKAVLEKLRYVASNPASKFTSDVRQLFRELLLFFSHTYADVYGISEGPPLHDPLAVAVVLFDVGAMDLAFDDRDGERWHVSVVTDGDHSDDDHKTNQVGRTVISSASGGGVRIPRGLDVARFWDVIEDCLERVDIRTASLGKRLSSSVTA